MESTFIITTDCLKKTHRSAYLANIMVQLTMAYDSSTITVPQLDHTNVGSARSDITLARCSGQVTPLMCTVDNKSYKNVK